MDGKVGGRRCKLVEIFRFWGRVGLYVVPYRCIQEGVIMLIVVLTDLPGEGRVWKIAVLGVKTRTLKNEPITNCKGSARRWAQDLANWGDVVHVNTDLGVVHAALAIVYSESGPEHPPVLYVKEGLAEVESIMPSPSKSHS